MPRARPALEQAAALTRAQAQARGISTKAPPAPCLQQSHSPPAAEAAGAGAGHTWLQRLRCLSAEGGQLWNSSARGRGCNARAQVGTVHEVCSDARQVWQVGRHIDLGDLTQVWHIEVVLSYLQETQTKKIQQ